LWVTPLKEDSFLGNI